jgi:SAM-dependent methyltransferase
MTIGRLVPQALFWTALTATTALCARWLRNVIAEQPTTKLPGAPASCEPAAARDEQRLADTLLWRLAERQVVRRAFAPFRIRPPLRRLRVLNLDHGPGGIAAALAAEAPQDACVVALDHLPGMADLARHRATRRRPRAPLAFTQGWTYALPFSDGTFDLVVSAGGLHEWPRPEETMGEIRRVLRHEGRYWISDLRRDLSTPVWALIRAVCALFAPRDLKAFGEPLVSVGSSYAPWEVDWLAARAGLEGAHIETGLCWLTLAGLPATPDDPATDRASVKGSRQPAQEPARMESHPTSS